MNNALITRLQTKFATGDEIRILFVCHGNICRSTMAECVMKYYVGKTQFSDRFYIDSAATSREEIGNVMHSGTARVLRASGIPAGNHRARQITAGDCDFFDLLVGMDSANLRNMAYVTGGLSEDKGVLLSSFAGLNRDIADPWYTRDFDATYRDVTAGCSALLALFCQS